MAVILMAVCEKLGKVNEPNGTTITFKPDPAFFKPPSSVMIPWPNACANQPFY